MSPMGKIGSQTAQAGRFVAGWVEDRTGAIRGTVEADQARAGGISAGVIEHDRDSI